MDTDKLLEALHQVIDPEVGVNIVDLGLIERIEPRGNDLQVDLIMTSPACPLGDSLACEVELVLAPLVAGTVLVDLLQAPAWTPARMSESARRQLGWEQP